MRNGLFILTVLVAIIAASGCTTQPGTGELVLKITDQPGLNIEEALVTISNVQVHMPSEDNESGWVTVVEGPVEYDLVELIGVEQILGETVLPAGIYTQIRLEVGSAVVTIDGEEHTLTIPSGSVKLVRAFEIMEGETTELTLDFDAQDSIHQSGPNYIMRPAIRVLGPSPGDGRDGEDDGQDLECTEDADCSGSRICVDNECVEPQGGPQTGNFMLMVSDAPADIGDFDSLVVSFSGARVFMSGEPGGFDEFGLEGTQVDLTEVVGEKAVSVLNVPLSEGTYTKVEMHVADVEGIVNGSDVDVMVPSNKLQIVRPFEIVEGEDTMFVFDINVVRKGHSDEYNLLPVIGKSGVVGKDLDDDEVEEAECTVDGDCDGGEVCRNGECREAEEAECETDDDCGESEACIEGECEEIEEPECAVDSDCGEGQVCLEGECEEAEEDPICYSPNETGMLLSDAILIAGSSKCMLNGSLEEDDYQCNNVTGTWWIELDPFEEAPGCNPACVVDIEAQEAEINWRCTGLNP